jgi:hypothetical protein
MEGLLELVPDLPPWAAMNGPGRGRIITCVHLPKDGCRGLFVLISSGTPQKEVERRRRGNINEGINELGRIVPNGTGEKAKGAILSRAVQYIHHLKENEARNIEKWTLEKLLMDQAMGDLQTQLEEMRRLWDEERTGRQRAEGELEVLRGLKPGANKNASTAVVSTRSKSPESGPNSKRRSAGVNEEEEEGEEGRAKRHRVD